MSTLYFAGSRSQVAEILQASGRRLASFDAVCQMTSAKSLLNATCSLLNQKGAF